MSERSKDADLAYCELIALLAIADAAVTDEERLFLDDIMSKRGLTQDERSVVMSSVDIGDPVAPRVARLDDAGRATLIEDLELAAASDGEVAPGERQVIADAKAALRR